MRKRRRFKDGGETSFDYYNPNWKDKVNPQADLTNFAKAYKVIKQLPFIKQTSDITNQQEDRRLPYDKLWEMKLKYGVNPVQTPLELERSLPLKKKYKDGGNISAYNPLLASKDKEFQDWYSKNTLEGKNKIPYSDSLDYDYYSFFKNKGQGDIQNHFPDTYKRPNHKTFSDESIYSTPENPGGHWDKDNFIPHINDTITKDFQYKNGGTVKRNRRNIVLPIKNYNNPQGMREGASIQPNRMMFNFGGTAGSILSAVAPIAGMIPGIGTIIGGAAGLAGNAISQASAGQKFDPAAAIMGGIGGAGGALGMAGNILPKPTMGQGGNTQGVDINVEGNNRSEGNSIQMAKGELLTSKGKVLKNYVARPPHPAEGMNPQGNTTETEGTVVIPKNRTQEYLSADKRGRKMIEESLKSQQDWRANRALKMLKKGGLIHSGMYAKGGKIRMDDGGMAASDINNLGERWGQTSYLDQIQNNPYGIEGYSNYQYDPFKAGNGPVNPNPSPTTQSAPNQPLMKSQNNSLRDLQPDNYGAQDWYGKEQGNQGSKRSPLNDIMSYAAPAYNIGQGLFGQNQQLNPNDYQVKGRMPYRDMNADQVQRGITSAERSGAADIRNHGQGYLPARIALSSRIADSRAKANEDIHNINAQGRNQADQVNLGIEGHNAESRFRTADWNAKSSQTKNNFLAAGMGDLSKIGQNANNNDLYKDWYKDAFPNAKPLRAKRGGRVMRKLNY